MAAQLIALTGLAQSGKSTVARYLVEEHGFTLIKFADPLKDMLRVLLSYGDMDDFDIERAIEGDLKEVPLSVLEGCSARHAMLTLGTEWGRDQIDPDLWACIGRHRIKRHLDAGLSVVVDDCRFNNEANAIHKLGGRIIKIIRSSGAVTPLNHISEAGCGSADEVILNLGQLPQLFAAVREVL